MSVDVHIAIVCADGANQLCIAEAEASVSLDGADVLLLGHHIVEDVSVVEGEQVAGAACLHVYHGPHASCIAKGTSVGVLDGEVTVGKEFHDTLHPCAYLAMLIVARHLHHLYGQAGEHPSVARLVQRTYAPATLLRMVAGGIEKMVAQHTEEHPAGEVHVEGFYVYGMCVYLVHLSISRCVRYWSSRSTRLLVTAIRPERTN